MEHVPALSIVGMVFTILTSLVLPLAALIWFRRRTKTEWRSFLIGALTFVLFALVLEGIVNVLVLGTLGVGWTGNIWLYGLYGGLAAGIFEETGRYLAMKFLMKNRLTKENSIMYGLGHGGIEAIILVGLSSVANLIASIAINSGSINVSLDMLDSATRAETISQLAVLWETKSGAFFAAGVERVSAIILQICLSYIVYRSIKDKKISLFLLAIALHAAIDFVVAVMARLVSLYAMEATLFVMTVIFAIIIYKKYRAEASREEDPLFAPVYGSM